MSALITAQSPSTDTSFDTAKNKHYEQREINPSSCTISNEIITTGGSRVLK